MADTNTLLLAVTKDYSVQIGLPPRNMLDRFKDRAIFLGKLKDVYKLACSPDGELFCIRDRDLYRGPMPSGKDVDWFSVARRVGRGDWLLVSHIFFHPNGDFYACKYAYGLYKGPPPDNEHVPWFHDQAKSLAVMYLYFASVFDTKGNLYGVHNQELHMGPPPTGEGDALERIQWKGTLVESEDWLKFMDFLAFTPDNKLWAMDRENGNLYRGDPPTPENPGYLKKAEYVGWNYNQYRFLAFTKDKTIQNIISFQFLTDQGKKLSETPEVLQEKIYDNRKSTSTMRHSFKVSKTVKESSSFTHDHGFAFEMGIETTFKSGVPAIAEAGVTVSMNMSTTHNWSFTKTNETENTFEEETAVELDAGKAIRMVASVLKAKISVPYKAKARTMFGAEVEVTGKWLGVSHYHLMVTQEDYDK